MDSTVHGFMCTDWLILSSGLVCGRMCPTQRCLYNKFYFIKDKIDLLLCKPKKSGNKKQLQ